MHTATTIATINGEHDDLGTDATETGMEHRPQTSVAVVGILITILIFLLVQTAGVAFWAGGQSSKQDATTIQMTELKTQVQYLQAQIQVMTTKMAAIEAKEEAKNGNGNGKGR